MPEASREATDALTRRGWFRRVSGVAGAAVAVPVMGLSVWGQLWDWVRRLPEAWRKPTQSVYIRGPRYRVAFDRITVPHFTRDVDELATRLGELRDVLAANPLSDAGSGDHIPFRMVQASEHVPSEHVFTDGFPQ